MNTTNTHIIDKHNLFLKNNGIIKAWKSLLKQAVIVTVIIIATTICSLYLFTNKELNFNDVLIITAWSTFYSLPMFFINAILFDFIEYKRNFNWSKPILRFIEGIIASGIVSAVFGLLLVAIQLLINGKSFEDLLSFYTSKEVFGVMQRMAWISMTISAFFYVINFVKYREKKKVQVQEFKNDKVNSEHEALKSQIGPHFLFNSLNVLNGLIDENKDKAQEFVAELSTVYRYVLTQKEKNTVPLEEEIQFGKTYLNLVQKRFEEGLQYEFKPIVFHDDMQIVPLSLQLLLENCIKHNAISESNPLKIFISLKDDYVVVTNNINPKKTNENSLGTGLQSIVNRYQNLSEDKVLIEKNESYFTVKIPIIST